MPYENKYDELPYVVQGDNSLAVRSYLQDIAYSSEALKAFLERLDELPERTLVVFGAIIYRAFTLMKYKKKIKGIYCTRQNS